MIFCLLLFTGIFAVQQAEAQVVVKKEVWNWEHYIPCLNDGAGEWVIGTINMITIVYINDDGEVILRHTQPTKSSMIGEETGMIYQVGGATLRMLDKNTLNGATTYKWVNRYRLVGKGVQFYIKRTIHTTVNANGDITSEVDNYSSECK